MGKRITEYRCRATNLGIRCVLIEGHKGLHNALLGTSEKMPPIRAARRSKSKRTK